MVLLCLLALENYCKKENLEKQMKSTQDNYQQLEN